MKWKKCSSTSLKILRFLTKDIFLTIFKHIAKLLMYLFTRLKLFYINNICNAYSIKTLYAFYSECDHKYQFVLCNV